MYSEKSSKKFLLYIKTFLTLKCNDDKLYGAYYQLLTLITWIQDNIFLLQDTQLTFGGELCTTRSTSGISKPRAATLVATRTLNAPFLKPFSVISLCFWGMSPCNDWQSWKTALFQDCTEIQQYGCSVLWSLLTVILLWHCTEKLSLPTNNSVVSEYVLSASYLSISKTFKQQKKKHRTGTCISSPSLTTVTYENNYASTFQPGSLCKA